MYMYMYINGYCNIHVHVQCKLALFHCWLSVELFPEQLMFTWQVLCPNIIVKMRVTFSSTPKLSLLINPIDNIVSLAEGKKKVHSYYCIVYVFLLTLAFSNTFASFPCHRNKSFSLTSINMSPLFMDMALGSTRRVCMFFLPIIASKQTVYIDTERIEKELNYMYNVYIVDICIHVGLTRNGSILLQRHF